MRARIHYSAGRGVGMPESQELSKARRCLARAEAELRSADGLRELVEGLALLEDLIGAGSTPAARTARNLATSYAARIYARVGETLAGDAQLPEPELEHFFQVVLAFDHDLEKMLELGLGKLR